jgi:hypothetical protein
VKKSGRALSPAPSESTASFSMMSSVPFEEDDQRLSPLNPVAAAKRPVYVYEDDDDEDDDERDASGVVLPGSNYAPHDYAADATLAVCF